MRILAAAAVVLTLTGCGRYGEPLLLAHISNTSDPCQMYNKPPGHQFPTWCGASDRGSVITRDYRTGRYLTQQSPAAVGNSQITRDYRTGRYLTEQQ